MNKLPKFRLSNAKRPSIQCVCCLYRIGLGYDRISRIVPHGKRSVACIIQRRGLIGTRTLINKIYPKGDPEQDGGSAKQLRFQKRLNNLPNRKRKLRLRTYLWKWVRRNLNPFLMPTIVGCSREYLLSYLQSKFTRKMSWNNYATAWQIDHIIPCSKFNLTDHSQVLQCFHFSNLQPLLIKDNKTKGGTLKPTQAELLISG